MKVVVIIIGKQTIRMAEFLKKAFSMAGILFFKVNILKTIYFNLKCLPFRQAWRLPVFIYRRTKLYRADGQIIIHVQSPPPGLVKIGPYGLGTQDMRYSRTIWDVSGTLVVNGYVTLGRGSRISIERDGVLTLGNHFTVTGDSALICQKEICFGDDCLLSWEILVMDTDFHAVVNGEGTVINAPRSIKIGNHVWIGCRNTILKGVEIGDSNIISAGSILTRSFSGHNCIVGGQGAEFRVLKDNVDWRD